jgi:hypothetical protein
MDEFETLSHTKWDCKYHVADSEGVARLKRDNAAQGFLDDIAILMTPGRETPAFFASVSCVQPRLTLAVRTRAPSELPGGGPIHSTPRSWLIRSRPDIDPRFSFSSSHTVFTLMARASAISRRVLPFDIRSAWIRSPMFIFVTSLGKNLIQLVSQSRARDDRVQNSRRRR